MRYGVNLPPFGDFADPAALAELAREAEAAGWDGFFIWDHMVFDPSWHPMADPWVGLAAAAVGTQRIRLGTLLTPLPRRRPWKLARETVSVDRLSGGRLSPVHSCLTPEEICISPMSGAEAFRRRILYLRFSITPLRPRLQ